MNFSRFKSDPFWGNVRRSVEKHRMLSPGDRVVVAVSGGPDSVCLLSVLKELAPEWDLTLHIAHLDHMFRGEESAADARFVADLAKQFGIPATIEAMDVPSYCRERGLSAQAGAREARYAFLERVARNTGGKKIALGHTANDQAETFLMRLMRGAGASGLSAIPPVRRNIIRPLIESTREAVVDHLRLTGLEYRTDPSNEKSLYTRNRIRLEVLPLLARFNPRIVETLAAEASLLRDENAAVEAYLAGIAESAVLRKVETLTVKRDVFDALPPAFRRRLLRMIVEHSRADAASLSQSQVDDALSFMMTARTGRTMLLPGGLTITREYNRFVVGGGAAGSGFSVALPVPGECEVPELGLVFTAEVRDHAQESPERMDAPNSLWQAEFDYAKIAAPLSVRNRNRGDRFHPAGMEGRSKKLQDYFTDEKVPRRRRDTVPLLCSGSEIIWIVGMRTDERFLSKPGTRRKLVVHVRNAGSIRKA